MEDCDKRYRKVGIYLHGAKFELCKVTLVLSIVRSTFIYVGRM